MKSKIFFSVVGLMLLMVSLVAGTTVTLDAPANSGVVTGSAYNFTATVAFTDNFNVSFCTFATTDDGVFGNSSLGNITGYWNVSDSSALTQTSSTTVTVSCHNVSNNAAITDTSTTVPIDNNDPTCAFTLQFPNMNFMGQNKVDASGSTDAQTSIASYAWNLLKPDNSVVTATAQPTTFRGSDFNLLGSYTVNLTVTDDAGLTNDCTARTIFVSGSEDDAASAGNVITGEEKSSRTAAIVVVIIIVLALAATAVIIGVNKSKR